MNKTTTTINSVAQVASLSSKKDRHRGVKYALHVPADLDDRLTCLKPEPVPKSKMMLVALKHYLDDARAYGIDPRTLLPLSPKRPHVPTPEETMNQEDQHEATK